MNHRPLVIGEVLFDQFPDGSVVLGGAPFNVAWHLHGMGLNPLFISAVGDDAAGQQIRDTMAARGMDTTGLQISPTRSTGKVLIQFDQGQPNFTIPPEQSFDDIRYQEHDLDEQTFSLIYAGTLGGRFPTTRATIQRWFEVQPLPIFVDVNLRDPWCDPDWLDELLQRSTWLKMNREELARISKSPCQSEMEIGTAIVNLKEGIGNKPLFVTCGAEGAYAMEKTGELHFSSSTPPGKVVDSVGAGDAFSAATMYGLILGQPLNQTLRKAVRFAAGICTMTGAVPTSPDWYQPFKSDSLVADSS